MQFSSCHGMHQAEKLNGRETSRVECWFSCGAKLCSVLRHKNAAAWPRRNLCHCSAMPAHRVFHRADPTPQRAGTTELRHHQRGGMRHVNERLA
jgi:hypothetical protein